MWPFRKKQGRRLEAAQARAEARAQRFRELRQSGLIGELAVGLLFAILGTCTLLIGGRTPGHMLGEYLEQPLSARVAFDGPALTDSTKVQHFNRGDTIADFGTIDEADMDRIRAEQEAFVASPEVGSLVRHILGLASVMLLATVGFGLLIVRYEPDVTRRTARLIGLSTLLLGVMLVSRLSVVATWQSWFRVGVTAAATMLAVMILCIVYDRRFALGIGWFLTLLMVVAARQNYSFIMVLLAGLTVAGLGLNEVRSRTKLVGVGLASAVVMGLTTLGVGMIGGYWDEQIWWRALAAGVAGLAAGLIMQGVLPLVERMFGIATSITLLEFSDVSRPLLRRLAAEAPGTFNHSLLLGTMAEAAAEAIGANGLLARVGAYYHDIGKINKPGYFVENQEGSYSRHAKLSPAMSLLIILGHVKDGLELAREYNVPKVIYPFITEHHGTTLVEYFYHAAAQRQQGDQEPPAESQFRYPGPRPHSKETAILMLCDSAESAARSLAEPTPARIEDVVHQIARKKLHDGQLDECDLTLRELHMVEQSLIKSLWGFYHGRIAYPSTTAEKSPVGTKTA